MKHLMTRAAAAFLLVAAGVAAQPIVSTVPANPTDSTRRHETFSSRTITLKGVTSVRGPQYQATWDFGDGSQSVSFPVENSFDISATHAYYGPTGTEYTAKLTVTDSNSGESSSAQYQIVVLDKSLAVEAAVATDEALWYLHKSLQSGSAASPAWDVLAMESLGYLPSGDSSNPYTGTLTQAVPALLANPDASARDAAWYQAIALSGTAEARRFLAGVGANAVSIRAPLGMTGNQDLPTQLYAETLAGVGRPDPRWTWLESQMRNQNNFNLGTASLFELSQALRNHRSNGVLNPVQYIQSDAMGAIDWYGAELNAGASTDGVARVLLNRQAADGSFGDPAEATAQAVLILSQDIIVSPVTNVSAQTTVTRTAFAYNRSLAKYIGNLTVTNTGGQVIAGPLNVGILNLPAAVTLFNATGQFDGAPYINVVGAGSINPGDAHTVQLQFTVNPATAITFNTVVYAGAFPPSALSVGCPVGTATMGTAYSSAFAGTGGVQAYSYSVTSGSLPHNLTLDPNAGTVSGTPDTAATSNFTATVTDSSGPTPQTANMSCSIVVSSATGPNQPPSFTKGADQTVLENAGAQTVTGWATNISPGPPSQAGETVHFNVTGNTNPSLFSVAPAISPTGTLTYTPATNTSGAASVSITLQNSGGTANGGMDTSATQTFNITVSFVNQAPTFTKGADQSVAENAGTQTVTGWATNISPGPANESGQTVHFNVTGNTNAALFSVAPAISPTGTLTYTPAANVSGAATVTITLQDNGGTANGGADTSAPQTFNIGVNFVNQAPAFTKGADKTVLENSGAATVSPWATGISPGPPSESGQTVHFNVTGNTNPSLFSAGPAISSTGVLTFTPAANSSGSASLTITLQDNGGTANGGVDTSAPQTFNINVTFVNQAPSFTKGPDQAVNKNSGAQTVNGWATSISPGPPNESGQTVHFNVTADTNPSLFSTTPAVSSTGTLTYTPATGQTGSATITINLQDNGGTANGGVDTSSSQTFVITVNDPPQITSGNTATFAPGKTGQSFTVTTTGSPSGAAMTISAGSGFPTGVSLTNNNNGTATISGTPASGTAGSSGTPHSQAYPVTITANNGVTPNAMQSFTLNVTCPAITVSGASTINAVYNVVLPTSTYTQSNGNGTIAWSATGLPTNLAIGSGTGIVSGTPNQTGVFSATVTATDAGGCTGTEAVTVNVGPNLLAQSYNGIGNTQFFISGVAGAPTTPAVSSTSGLLTGATPASGLTVSAASCTSGGTIAFDSAGRFIFTPNVSATGAACTYTAVSNTGSGAGSTGAATATATITFTLYNKVWYVSHGSTGSHDGRSNSPFLDLGGGTNNLDCTNGTSAGDYIYVSQGTAATAGACALQNNQSLIGAGATLSILGLTVPGNSASTPTLTGGLSASGALNLTVNGVSVSTTGSTVAVNLVNSDGNFTFQSITATGGGTGTNGIVWNNSTSAQAVGSFTVNGDGANTTQGGNSTGGTISGMSGPDGGVAGSAIYLNTVSNVTLNRMTINGTNSNYGIRGIGVINFTLAYSTIGGTNGTSNTAEPEGTTGTGGEGSIRFTNLKGTGSINGSVLDGGFSRTGMFYTSAGTLGLTISNSVMKDTSTNAATSDSLLMQAIGSSTMNLTVTSSSFTAYRQNAIQTDARGTATMSVNISSSTFENNNTNPVSGAGSLSLGSSSSTDTLVQFNINGNSFRHGSATVTAPGNGGAHLVAGTIGGAGKFDGKFVNNTVGVLGVANSGAGAAADAVRLFASGNLAGSTRVTGTTDTRYLVQGNTVDNYGEVGILIDARQGTSTLDATVSGNTVTQPNANSAFAGIWANSGALSGDTNTLNIVIGDANTAGNKNTLAGSDPNAVSDVFLENDSATGAHLNLYKNGSSSGTAATVLTDDNNPTLNLSGATSGTIGLVSGVPPTVP